MSNNPPTNKVSPVREWEEIPSYRWLSDDDQRSSSSSNESEPEYPSSSEDEPPHCATEKHGKAIIQGVPFKLQDLRGAWIELVGEGSCGRTYKLSLTNGLIVEAKRIERNMKPCRKEDGEAHLHLIQSFRHPNIHQLLAFHHFDHKKVLFYEYIPSRTLHASLHGHIPTRLDWDTRVKLALGVAQGLNYIHTKFSLVHGNLKSSNILIEESGEARLSELGFTMFMQPIVASSNGYMAPEQDTNGLQFTSIDVYAYGILLLELLTGKDPSLFRQDEKWFDMNLVEWVQSEVMDNQMINVFDQVLLSSCEGVVMWLEEMLRLALACIQEQFDLRPSMEKVVRIIRRIKMKQSPFCHGDKVFCNVLGSINTSGTVRRTSRSSSTNPSDGNLCSDIDPEGSELAKASMTKIILIILTTIEEEKGDAIILRTSSNLIEEVDIGIPADYISMSSMKAHHQSILKVLLNSLPDLLKSNPQFGEVLKCLRNFTSTLVAVGAPLDNWNSIAQHILQATKQIDALKMQLKEVNVTSTTFLFETHQVELHESVRIFEEKQLELENSYKKMAASEQEQAALQTSISSMEVHLEKLRGRSKTLAKSIDEIRSEYYIQKKISDQQKSNLESQRNAMASITQKLQKERKIVEEKQQAISNLFESINYKISSLSCDE